MFTSKWQELEKARFKVEMSPKAHLVYGEQGLSLADEEIRSQLQKKDRIFVLKAMRIH